VSLFVVQAGVIILYEHYFMSNSEDHREWLVIHSVYGG